MPTRDESIQIPVAGERIAGTLVVPSTVIPGVLYLHGWGGNQKHYLARAREVAALGCVALTVDLRGHARTRAQHGTVTREDNLRDALAAYDTLIMERHVDAADIAVAGSSYGGYLAAILTTLRPVKWLALRAPALYKDAGWTRPKVQLHKDQELHAYRRQHVRAQDNRALRACAAFTGDVLIVESEHDEIVPHPVIASYLEAFRHARSLTYRVIAGADHGLSEASAQQAYTTLLVTWLTEMIFGVRQGGTRALVSVRANATPKAVRSASG
jgi:uncharacterized protein